MTDLKRLVVAFKPEELEIDTSPGRYALTVGTEQRAPVDPIAGCTVMAYDVLRAHMPHQNIDLPIHKYR